jgi:hypothetical protein
MRPTGRSSTTISPTWLTAPADPGLPGARRAYEYALNSGHPQAAALADSQLQEMYR